MIQNTRVLYRADLSLGARMTHLILQNEDAMRFEGGYGVEPWDLVLTNEELAAAIGKSVPAVRKYLAELKSAGLIYTKIRNAGTEFFFSKQGPEEIECDGTFHMWCTHN